MSFKVKDSTRSAKYFKCPGCGAVMDEHDLFCTEGACINYGNPDPEEECRWEDELDEILQREYESALAAT